MASRAANCVRLKRCSPKVACAEQAQRENDRRKERGILAGRSKKNCGPHLTAVLQPTDRRFVSCTDSRPESFPAPPLEFPSLLRSLTRSPCLLATGEHSASLTRTFS